MRYPYLVQTRYRKCLTSPVKTVWSGCFSGPYAVCTLEAFPWRAQYFVYDVDDGAEVLVEDVLTYFTDGTFTQNITAFPFQDCGQNSIFWSGEYVHTNDAAIQSTYVRCTASGPGCLRCGPTRQEWATFSFPGVECALLVIKSESDVAERTYVPL